MKVKEINLQVKSCGGKTSRLILLTLKRLHIGRMSVRCGKQNNREKDLDMGQTSNILKRMGTGIIVFQSSFVMS